jgi:competence protein ComEC
VTTILPAHAALAGAAAGLSLALLAAPRPGVLALLVLAAALAAASEGRGDAGRLGLLAAVALVLGWWWGGVRVEQLGHSLLAADVDRSGPALVETTAEARRGTFDQRQFGRVVRFDGRAIGERVELRLPLGRSPPQGARLLALAVVRAPAGPKHGFDERAWLARQGIHVVVTLDSWRIVGKRGGVGGTADGLRAWLRRASAPGVRGERRAVLEGILLGDDAGLSPSLKQAFRRSGLYHLLAVSGQNVVLLAGGVLAVAYGLGLARVWGHLGALAAIGAYVLAVGPQPSVVRAAIAGGAVSIAWLAGRERERWHLLLLGAVVLLAWNPYNLQDPGFQLSFGAVAAIFLAVGPLTRLLEGYPVPRRAAGPVAVSAACAVATAPVLWLQFGAVPLLGVGANVLVEAVVAPLLALAFAAAALDPVAPSLAADLAWVNGWIAAYIAFCARAVAAVPFAQVRGPWAAGAAAAALLGAALALRPLSRLRTSTG